MFWGTIIHAYAVLHSLLTFTLGHHQKHSIALQMPLVWFFMAFLIITVFYWISPSLSALLLQNFNYHGSQYSRWVFKVSSIGLLNSSLSSNDNIFPDTIQAYVWLMIFLSSAALCPLSPIRSCPQPLQNSLLAKNRWVCILNSWTSSHCCFSNT